MNSAADKLANEAMDLAARGREWQPRPGAYADGGTDLEESSPQMSESTLSEPSVPTEAAARLAYRLLTGPDDAAFCERVSAALAEGYRLHGDPAIAVDGERVVVAQALVDPRILGFGS
jgi:hypothetical protein